MHSQSDEIARLTLALKAAYNLSQRVAMNAEEMRAACVEAAVAEAQKESAVTLEREMVSAILVSYYGALRNTRTPVLVMLTCFECRHV